MVESIRRMENYMWVFTLAFGQNKSIKGDSETEGRSDIYNASVSGINKTRKSIQDVDYGSELLNN